MTRSYPRSQLHEALEQYGRRARRLSESRMLSVDVVLCQLGDDTRLSDPRYREQLARRVVTVLRSLITAIADPVDRRIAEAVLAATPEFHDKTVEQRRAFVREHDLGFTDEQFKTRRARVIGDLAAELAEAFCTQPATQRIFIGGNYTDPIWDRDAAELGVALAELPVAIVSGSALPGRRIAYAMADALAARGIYAPTRVMLFAQANADKPTQADRPIGTLTYFGINAMEKRREMLRISRLAILFGGARGTAEEAELADMHGIPVVPLAFTGGTARQYWFAHRAETDAIMLGGKPADARAYAMLNHEVHSLALQAAVQLVRQALALTV